MLLCGGGDVDGRRRGNIVFQVLSIRCNVRQLSMPSRRLFCQFVAARHCGRTPSLMVDRGGRGRGGAGQGGRTGERGHSIVVVK